MAIKAIADIGGGSSTKKTTTNNDSAKVSTYLSGKQYATGYDKIRAQQDAQALANKNAYKSTSNVATSSQGSNNASNTASKIQDLTANGIQTSTPKETIDSALENKVAQEEAKKQELANQIQELKDAGVGNNLGSLSTAVVSGRADAVNNNSNAYTVTDGTNRSAIDSTTGNVIKTESGLTNKQEEPVNEPDTGEPETGNNPTTGNNTNTGGQTDTTTNYYQQDSNYEDYYNKIMELLNQQEEARKKSNEESLSNTMKAIANWKSKAKRDALGAYEASKRAIARSAGNMSGAKVAGYTTAGNTYNNNLTDINNQEAEYNSSANSDYYNALASILGDTLNNKLSLYNSIYGKQS